MQIQLAKSIENTLGRLRDQKSRRNAPFQSGPEPPEES